MQSQQLIAKRRPHDKHNNSKLSKIEPGLNLQLVVDT